MTRPLDATASGVAELRSQFGEPAREDLGFKPPFTLGHENAGWVSALGEGVTGFKEGDAAAVYGPWGCGRCHACQRSMENYCENWAQMDGFGGGLGLDGGMAEYMLVPSARLLVPLGGLSPAKSRSAERCRADVLSRDTAGPAAPQRGKHGCRGWCRRSRAHGDSASARALAPVRIIAADVDDKKLQQAKALGTDEIVNNRNASEAAVRIRQITGPRGAGLVLDCIGVQPTVDLGAQLLGRNSVWTIVGLGGGRHEFRHGSTPYGTSMSIPYWGSRVELMDVIAMARNGRIHAETTEFPLTEAVDVYARLKAGQIHPHAPSFPTSKTSAGSSRPRGTSSPDKLIAFTGGVRRCPVSPRGSRPPSIVRHACELASPRTRSSRTTIAGKRRGEIRRAPDGGLRCVVRGDKIRPGWATVAGRGRERHYSAVLATARCHGPLP